MPFPVHKEPPISLIVAAVLMLMMGLSIGLSGLILLFQGEATLPEVKVRASILPLFGLFLLLFGATELVAAVEVLRLKHLGWVLGVLATVALIASGAINGFFFFGRAGAHGTVLNLVWAALVIVCLLLGRRAFAKQDKRHWH